MNIVMSGSPSQLPHKMGDAVHHPHSPGSAGGVIFHPGSNSNNGSKNGSTDHSHPNSGVSAATVSSSSSNNSNISPSTPPPSTRPPPQPQSAPAPSQYVQQQHPQQQQQRQSRIHPQQQSQQQQRGSSSGGSSGGSSGPPMSMPMMGLGPAPSQQQSNGFSPYNNNNINLQAADPSSFPWTIGSTDGSFAIVNLMQRQQEIQLRQQQQQQQQSGVAALPADDPAAAFSPNIAAKPKTVGIDSDGTTIDADTVAAVTAAIGGATIGISGEAAIATEAAAIANTAGLIQMGRSLYHDKLFHQSSSSVEAVLAASCEVMGFDIAEMWLRTGPKTHQLTNSHLRPTALEDSVRQDLVEVYYGDTSNERTDRLSPALCKRAKDANDVVWVTAHTQNGAEALRMSISNVRTAVAVPVCHEASNTNITIIYFSIRRIVLRPSAVEFLIHMSLSAAVTSVNALALDGLIDNNRGGGDKTNKQTILVDSNNNQLTTTTSTDGGNDGNDDGVTSRSEHGVRGSKGTSVGIYRPTQNNSAISYQRADKTSITGARLDLQWRQLLNVEYLTDGGNSWIHTAIFDGKPVVVKTLRPECQDTALAINEIEAEVGKLVFHSLLASFASPIYLSILNPTILLSFVFANTHDFLFLFDSIYQLSTQG